MAIFQVFEFNDVEQLKNLWSDIERRQQAPAEERVEPTAGSWNVEALMNNVNGEEEYI